MELSSIFGGIVVRVTDERSLEVIMELAVADSDEVNGVSEIEEPIVEILAAVHVAGQIDVVDPYIGRFLDSDGISAGSSNLGDLQIANDNILLSLHAEA